MEYRNSNNTGNMFGVFLAGVAAGAAAVFFSKKENREKLKNSYDRFNEQGRNLMKDAKEKAREVEGDIRKHARDIKERSETEAEKAKRAVEEMR